MGTGTNSRFEAETVGRLTTVNKGRRFEIEFCDSAGKQVIVSLPVAVAVELGCTICDVSEHAPYLVGGVRASRERLSRR